MRSRARPEMYRSVSVRQTLTRLDSSLTSSSEAQKTNRSEMSCSSSADRWPVVVLVLLSQLRHHEWPRGASERIKSVPRDVSRQTNQ